jgi:RNA polymerase sigma factor (sigma-70 family)
VEASVLGAPPRPGPILGTGPLLRLRADDQLVVLFRKGYDDAFEAIVARYKPRLLMYTSRMLGGSRHDAEDAMQDVFLKAYSALRDDERPLMLRAWLYRIAHNRCIDQIRRPAPAPRDVFDASRAPLPDPAVEAERREQMRWIVCDIGRLPMQQRSALLMRQIEGCSYAEIATALGLSRKAVKSLLVRARMSLAAADEARNTPCAEIRAELADSFERGVRMTGRSRQHLLDCSGCRAYKHRLRGLPRTLNSACAGHGVLATVAKVLGIGGAGSSAAVGAGTIAVGGPIAAKITALVCCGVAAAGMAEFKAHPTQVAPAQEHHRAARTAESTEATPKAAVLQHVDRRIPPAAAPVRRHAAVVHPKPVPVRELGSLRVPVDHPRYTTQPKPMTEREARSTGGTLAPDTTDSAPPHDASSIAPPDPPAQQTPAQQTPAPQPQPQPEPEPQTQAPAAAAATVTPSDPQPVTPAPDPAPTEPTGGVEAPPSTP